MQIYCDSEYARLCSVAVASPTFFHTTAPINVRQVHEYRRSTVDVGRLKAEHDAVLRSLRAASINVVEIEPHPNLPYLFNVRDSCVALGSHLVACRMGRPVRVPEPYWVSAQIAPAPGAVLRPLHRGKLEGGDVFQIAGDLLVGVGSRTSAAGISALAKAINADRVKPVELSIGVLHLDTVFNIIGQTAVIAPTGLVEPEMLQAWLAARHITDVIHVSEADALAMATNFLALTPNSVLTSEGCPGLADQLAARGITVRTVPMHEHHRIGGAVRCMTLPLRREPVEHAASAFSYGTASGS